MDRLDPALISVILFCRDAAATVNAAVGSALDQTYPGVQIVAVDDGSTDGSAEILLAQATRHPGRLLLLHLNRAGPCAARNHALAHADGSYIAFLDADEHWHPDALHRLHAALEDDGADLAYCGWHAADATGADPRPDLPPAFDARAALTHFLEHGPWPIGCALVRRRRVDALRGFSENRTTAMEYDFWLRLLADEPRLVRVPEALTAIPRDSGRIPHWRQVIDADAVRREFVLRHPHRVAHLPPDRLRRMLRAPLLREAYRCHWRGDSESARRLFRRAIRRADWKAGDLKHLLASLLPAPWYRSLVAAVARQRERV